MKHMERRVKKKVKRYRTIDEAGVSLARVFGDRTTVKLTEGDRLTIKK